MISEKSLLNEKKKQGGDTYPEKILPRNQENEKSENMKTKPVKIKTDLPQVVNSLKQIREERKVNDVTTKYNHRNVNDKEDNKLTRSKITKKKKYSKHKKNINLLKKKRQAIKVEKEIKISTYIDKTIDDDVVSERNKIEWMMDEQDDAESKIDIRE